MGLDDASRAFARRLFESGAKPIERRTAAEARDAGVAVLSILPPGPEMQRCDDQMAGVPGAQDVPVRVLVPRADPLGVIVYLHGGGWVTGGLDQSDSLGRHLAERTGCTVVVVDYRLAPEHPYPCGLDDAWTATCWAASYKASLSCSEAPLFVVGDSAGANLAAVVALRSRDRGGPRIALQVLVYPVTDCDLNRPSYRDPDNQLLLTRAGMRWFWDQYAPREARRDAELSPLRATDLQGLPPAVVLTAEHDPLRDEGELYAKRLAKADVHVVFQRCVGQMHGFFSLPGILPGCDDALATIAREVCAVTSR